MPTQEKKVFQGRNASATALRWIASDYCSNIKVDLTILQFTYIITILTQKVINRIASFIQKITERNFARNRHFSS